jgi:glutamate carboxypeptidase
MAARVAIGGSPAGLAREVRDHAADDLDLALADLRDWVALDTPSDDLERLDALARVIAQRMRAYGADVELEEGPTGLYLHATLVGTGHARVALLCHHDTVFPTGTAERWPFSIAEDVAHGPGVADMKGGLVVAAHALRLLSRYPGCFGRLELISVPDEELRDGPFRNIDRLDGFDAVLCMECGRPGNGVVTARKGGQWVGIDVEGRSAHAGVAADRGHSALLAVCREALRIAELEEGRRGLSVTATLLRAGEVLNSVPSTASLRLDVRAWSGADLDWAVAEIGRFGVYPGVVFRMDPGNRVPAFEGLEATGRLLEAAVSAGKALGTPVVSVSTGGVSDASWTAAMGIPTLDGLGPIGEDDHSPSERIVVSSIPERIALVTGVIASVEHELKDSTQDGGGS